MMAVMYKRALAGLVAVNMLFLCGYISVSEIRTARIAVAMKTPVSELKLDEALTADKSGSTLGITAVAASGQRVVGYHVLEKESLYDLSDGDLEALYRIVEAEAGSEDEDGKLLVANVVLNRMEDPSFPDTVEEVVFQEVDGEYQFSPAGSGRIYKVTVSDETVAAVQRALKGEDISQGALYFASRRYADRSRMSWFDTHLTYLFQHGGHEFYTSSR